VSYAIPNDATRTGICTYVEDTTPSDVWTPVGSIAAGLNAAISMRGVGYWKRHLVLHTAGAAQFTTLMTGLKENEDAITYGGQTYSVLSIDAQVLCSNDSRDVAKQCLVSVELWRP
jgi:hypothetical protein